MLATFHDLRNASVFITGGGNGIGAALTEGFVAQGARVAFVGRSDATHFVNQMAETHGNRPLFIPCDITDIPALHAAMDRAAEAHGPLSILVNNAANDTRYKAEDVTEAIWDASQAVNLKSYFFACQKAAAMMASRGGSIINFSSISYMIGVPELSTYVSANAGIMGLTHSLAREWGPSRIRVNAISPGWVMTERQKRLWASPEAVADFLTRQCIPEEMQPEDIVGAVLFLASGLSRMITGQNIVVDAGVVSTG
jgi:NAD(P)-dependent dehydrogenase (short-subunit alcohol dehydrogenase family)